MREKLKIKMEDKCSFRQCWRPSTLVNSAHLNLKKVPAFHRWCNPTESEASLVCASRRGAVSSRYTISSLQNGLTKTAFYQL